MASARSRRREKQFEELAKENARLHRDVEDLETAFFLHRQILQEEENSVQGLIRKEVGGSRWEHGGTGKLTTYTCSKDLQESAGNQTAGKYVTNGASALQTDNQTGRKPADSGSTPSLRNGTHTRKLNTNTTLNGKDKATVTDLYTVDDQHQAGDSDSGKILDLKTKVLKKARSKIINRDNWHSPVRHTENKLGIDNVGNASHKANKNSEKASKVTARPKSYVQPKKKSQKENLKSETYKVDRTKQEKAEDAFESHGLGRASQKANDTADEIHNIRYEVRQSRKDMHDNEKDKPNKPPPLKVDRVEGRLSNTYTVKETDYGNKERGSVEKLIVSDEFGADMRKKKLKEATEILIDPSNAQIRVRYGENKASSDYSRFEGSKISIEPEVSSQPDAGGIVEIPQSFKFSILDKDEEPQAASKISDVFGLQELVSKSDLQNGVKKTTASLSPFALTKDCDTEVEFWLRGLGLADIEDYVEIFAENEIDLLDLEFMSLAQLHDMGVTNPEALNKILKGVRELRNLPPDKLPKSDNIYCDNKRKGLQATSIAWEDPDIEQSRKEPSYSVLSGRKDSNFETSESQFINKTYTEGKKENLKSQTDDVDIDSSRCDSVKSNNSAYSRTSGKNQTFSVANAQTKASRRRQKSQLTNNKPSDRNQNSQSANADTKASARPASGKSDKTPPASKSQPQKRTPNQSIKKQKSPEPSADNKSRLQALEAKPTRSVLLKRSSSLTRENGRVQGRKASKGQDDLENRRPATRQRSRSAEAVKRKALEGVQAAAKKNEERLLKDRENEETKNKIQEKKKAERDEMAARHLKRERNKITVIGNAEGLEDKDGSPHPADDSGLESLVTVNILSQSDRKETLGKTTEVEDDKSKTRVIAPTTAARKSLRRIEPAKKSAGLSRTGVKPQDRLVQSDCETPLLSTYKLETQTREGATSEPESGYRTDTSATYSQVEEKVADIQLKIKRLKARATSGDDVTLTLVKDLQTELQHFERLLTEKEKSVKYKKPDKTAVTTPDWRKQENSIEHNGQRFETPTPKARAPSEKDQQSVSLPHNQQQKPLPKKLLSSVTQSSKDVSPRQENIIDDLLIEDTVVKGGDDVTTDKVAMSMSKKELLDEMRKEKHQHHRQIRQLQSELKRMRETDAASSMELNPDDIVYREEDLVGEGAFSQVFRGTYQGTEVAIKRLATPLAAQDRNYFAAEVSLLRELRHPRVVLLIGVCTSDKLPLMVLEFMSNGSLFNHLHNGENEPLDHAEYYQVARDVALGMNYLHSHKPEVLHLDLKSMNVLLCQSFRAKIADFGFSKLRHDASAKLTQKGKAKPQRGSPAWMAPELVDKGEITCKADVYGFAMILWEMLTRKLPYENASVFQVLEMVRKNKRPEVPRSCPDGLRQLISCCWDQNPAKRPHFKDIVSALENLAFPPAWRELFHKAGVPEEALHNIESTRTLINLVTTTLDSNSFSSFMISDSKDKRVQSEEVSSVTSGDTTASTIVPRKTIMKSTDDWESGTVSDITEISTERKSEFSLGSLTESADESLSNSDGETITENYGDESSELSSDDDTIVLPASSRKKSPRKKINVFVPNLQLSMKSPPVGDSAKDENSKFDWLSISLDDRTSREDRKSYRNSLEEQFLDLNLSSKSNIIVTPASQVSSANSKQQNQRKSWQEKAKEMDEYLMRESINNRRPPSPTRKRRSLTKKLADRTNRSLDIDDRMDNTVKTERMIYTDRPSTIGLIDSNDLTSLNRKLEELNSQTLELIHQKSPNKTVPPKEHFQNSHDSGLDFVKHLTSDEPVRVTLKDLTDSGSERNTRSMSFSNDKSYDSFYSLPFNNQVSTDGAFRKSEMTLKRSGSFTKSKDVLDLLATQIKNTTKTLATMDKESAVSISTSEVNRNSYSSISKELKQAVSTKQSLDNFSGRQNLDRHKSSDSPRIAAKSDVYNKNVTSETSKSMVTNKIMGKNVKTRDSAIKLPSKTVTLDEYHKFVNKDILHDSGGSIENLKSPVAQKSDEGASFIDPTEKNLQSGKEPAQISNDTKSDIIDVEECTDGESMLRIGTGFADVEHEQQETNCKETLEEKESIRVKLNPSDVINKKPVKTPRRSKMKESLDVSEVNGVKGDNEVKLVSDNLKVDPRSNEHVDITNLSEDEVVKKLKALEDFSEPEPSIMDESEILGPSVSSRDQVSKNEIVVKGKTKQSIQKDPKVTEDIDTESSLIKKTNSASETSHTSNRTDKVKLLVKDEHWRKLPEKPKEKKGKSNADEGSKKKSVLNTSKAATKVDDNSKISEKPTKTIRVKLKKDPLKPVLSEGPPSPVPPAPPPPPLTSLSVSTVTFSRSVQVPRPATSMADELKLRVESWQSRSYQKNIVKSKHEPVMRKSAIQSKGFPVMSKKFLESVTEASSNQLDDSLEDFELSDDQIRAHEGSVLVPQQSDGLPAFALQSVELREQRDHLKSISKPHPDQLDDLSHVSKEQLSSIAVLLRKAVSERRLALGEDSASVDQSMDSVSWSVETTPHPTPRL